MNTQNAETKSSKTSTPARKAIPPEQPKAVKRYPANAVNRQGKRVLKPLRPKGG